MKYFLVIYNYKEDYYEIKPFAGSGDGGFGVVLNADID